MNSYGSVSRVSEAIYKLFRYMNWVSNEHEHDANEHDANEHDANEHDANEHDANEHDANEHDANEPHSD